MCAAGAGCAPGLCALSRPSATICPRPMECPTEWETKDARLIPTQPHTTPTRPTPSAHSKALTITLRPTRSLMFPVISMSISMFPVETGAQHCGLLATVRFPGAYCEKTNISNMMAVTHPHWLAPPGPATFTPSARPPNNQHHPLPLLSLRLLPRF